MKLIGGHLNAPDNTAFRTWLKKRLDMHNHMVNKRNLCPQCYGEPSAVDISSTDLDFDIVNQYGFIKEVPPKPRTRDVDKVYPECVPNDLPFPMCAA